MPEITSNVTDAQAAWTCGNDSSLVVGSVTEADGGQILHAVMYVCTGHKTAAEVAVMDEDWSLLVGPVPNFGNEPVACGQIFAYGPEFTAEQVAERTEDNEENPVCDCPVAPRCWCEEHEMCLDCGQCAHLHPGDNEPTFDQAKL